MSTVEVAAGDGAAHERSVESGVEEDAVMSPAEPRAGALGAALEAAQVDAGSAEARERVQELNGCATAALRRPAGVEMEEVGAPDCEQFNGVTAALQETTLGRCKLEGWTDDEVRLAAKVRPWVSRGWLWFWRLRCATLRVAGVRRGRLGGGTGWSERGGVRGGLAGEVRGNGVPHAERHACDGVSDGGRLGGRRARALYAAGPFGGHARNLVRAGGVVQLVVGRGACAGCGFCGFAWVGWVLGRGGVFVACG